MNRLTDAVRHVNLRSQKRSSQMCFCATKTMLTHHLKVVWPGSRTLETTRQKTATHEWVSLRFCRPETHTLLRILSGKSAPLGTWQTLPGFDAATASPVEQDQWRLRSPLHPIDPVWERIAAPLLDQPHRPTLRGWDARQGVRTLDSGQGLALDAAR